jgi:MSHA biogenesis protein MshJ
MKSDTKLWAHYATKINALSLRERGILFGSALLVVAALADTLVLSPAASEQQQIKTKLSKLSNELTLLRAQVGASAGSSSASGAKAEGADKASPRATVLAAIQQTQEARRVLDEQLKRSLASPEQVARLPDLMAKVMRQQPNLTLAKLSTIAPDQDRVLLDKLEKMYQPTSMYSAAIAGSAPAVKQDARVHMHGVDVGVVGPYLELTRYLGELERALPGLRWGELRLHAEPDGNTAPLLEMRVYLMGASS